MKKLLLSVLIVFLTVNCTRIERKNMRKYNERLAALQAQIDALELLLNNQVSALYAQITSLSSDLSTTQTNISLMETTINNLQNDLVTLGDTNSDLENALNALENDLTALQAQVTALENSSWEIVYPCGEGNSEEVIIATSNGLLAYFQQTQTVNQNFTIGTPIPEYFVCNMFAGNSDVCVFGENIPASISSVNQTLSYQKISKAYLDVLADGTYQTTDGLSCIFTVSNGQIQ